MSTRSADASRIRRQKDPCLGQSGDFGQYPGPAHARLAAEAFAAGGHSLLIISRSAADRLALAELVPALLPDLSEDHSFQATSVHAAPWLTPWERPRLVRPPAVQVRPGCSVPEAIGGERFGRPGAVSLAHRGVLVLEDVPRFRRTVLNALGNALAAGSATLPVVGGQAFSYPARPQLVLTAAPCPCRAPDDDSCECTLDTLRSYLQRIPSRILDRIELRVNLDSPGPDGLWHHLRPASSTADTRRRAAEARARSAQRMSHPVWRVNAEFRSTPSHPFALKRGSLQELERLGLTPRDRGNVLRVAMTLADLAGQDKPGPDEVRAALQLFLGGDLG